MSKILLNVPPFKNYFRTSLTFMIIRPALEFAIPDAFMNLTASLVRYVSLNNFLIVFDCLMGLQISILILVHACYLVRE